MVNVGFRTACAAPKTWGAARLLHQPRLLALAGREQLHVEIRGEHRGVGVRLRVAQIPILLGAKEPHVHAGLIVRDDASKRLLRRVMIKIVMVGGEVDELSRLRYVKQPPRKKMPINDAAALDRATM